MLTKNELPIGEVSDSNQEDIRSRTAGEPGRLRVEEQDVLPAARGGAFEAEMGDEQRIARSPRDDLEPEIVDCDPPFAHFEARLSRKNGGIDRGPPRDGVPAGGRGVHRRVKRVSIDAAVSSLMTSTIAIDDLGDPGSEVVHLRRERRSATASRTWLPRA